MTDDSLYRPLVGYDVMSSGNFHVSGATLNRAYFGKDQSFRNGMLNLPKVKKIDPLWKIKPFVTC
jgi:hypothetical protein